MQRRDLPHGLILFVFLGSNIEWYCTGILGAHGGQFCLLVYGNIYSFLNARWHEFTRSAFKTRWLNDYSMKFVVS